LHPTAAVTRGVRAQMPQGAARQQLAASGRAFEGSAARGGDPDGVAPGAGRGTPPLSPSACSSGNRRQPVFVGVLRHPLPIRAGGLFSERRGPLVIEHISPKLVLDVDAPLTHSCVICKSRVFSRTRFQCGSMCVAAQLSDGRWRGVGGACERVGWGVWMRG